MTDRAKHVITFLGKVFAALGFAAAGVAILWFFHTSLGLVVGATSIAISLGIAFPTQFRQGAAVVREQLVLFIPIVLGAIPGGQRKDDPPADPPTEKPEEK